VIRYLTTHQHN